MDVLDALGLSLHVLKFRMSSCPLCFIVYLYWELSYFSYHRPFVNVKAEVMGIEANKLAAVQRATYSCSTENHNHPFRTTGPVIEPIHALVGYRLLELLCTFWWSIFTKSWRLEYMYRIVRIISMAEWKISKLCKAQTM